MNQLLISKNSEQIIISNKGKKLIIGKNESIFTELSLLPKEEIEKWYFEGR